MEKKFYKDGKEITLEDVQNELKRPFDKTRIKKKVAATKLVNGVKKGLLVDYIDARDVQNRLDEVVGPQNWHDEYELLQDDDVHIARCRLTVLGVTKEDIGYPNSADDAEPFKSAVSDALKRAAVKFGIGRDLYESELEWVALDKNNRPIKQDSNLSVFNIIQAQNKKIKELLKKLDVIGDNQAISDLIKEAGFTDYPKNEKENSKFIDFLTKRLEDKGDVN